MSQTPEDDLGQAQAIMTQLVSAAIATAILRIQEGITAAVDARITTHSRTNSKHWTSLLRASPRGWRRKVRELLIPVHLLLTLL